MLRAVSLFEMDLRMVGPVPRRSRHPPRCLTCWSGSVSFTRVDIRHGKHAGLASPSRKDTAGVWGPTAWLLGPWAHDSLSEPLWPRLRGFSPGPGGNRFALERTSGGSICSKPSQFSFAYFTTVPRHL